MSLRMMAIAALTALGAGVTPTMDPARIARMDDGTVVSLGVLPAAGRADIVVGVTGDLQVQDFTLADPARIVVDITGATLGLPTGSAYDGVPRGPVKMVRYSQLRPNVVRVTATVDSIGRHYSVKRAMGEVRISIDGAPDRFSAWQIGGDATMASVATVRDNLTPVLPAPIIPQQQQRIIPSISFDNTPIADVLKQFQDFSGRNILAYKGVSGTITGRVTNLPWDVALRELLLAAGYDATQDGAGTIVVEPLDQIAARNAARVAAEPLQTANVQLNFAKATSVLPMVKERLSRDCARAGALGGGSAATAPSTGGDASLGPTAPSSGVASLSCPVRGAVTADSVTNSLSITDIESSVVSLSAYAKTLDRRPAQVSIKAKIVLVDRTALEGLGLRYDLGSANQYFNDIVPRLDSTGAPQTGPGQIALGGNTVSAIANATQRIPSAALQLVYSTALGAFDFTSFLEALQQTSLLDTQAEPSGTTLNNHTVSLTAGADVPLRTIDAGSGGTTAGSFPRATVTLRHTGVILTVTPQVTNNGYIQMTVHVENSDVTFSGSDASTFPIQSVDNTVLVADGGTAVMGGLTQTTVSSTRTGIPILVDLPFIGKLFGVTQRQETKRDLLILITPHITDNGDPPGIIHE